MSESEIGDAIAADLDERITEALHDTDFTDAIVEVLRDSDEAHDYVNAIVTEHDIIGDLIQRVEALEETVKSQALLIEQQTTVLKQLVSAVGIS